MTDVELDARVTTLEENVGTNPTNGLLLFKCSTIQPEIQPVIQSVILIIQ